MKNHLYYIFVVLLITPDIAVSAEQEAANKNSFYFNPTVIDSKNGTGSTVGAEFKFNGELLSRNFESSETGDVIDPNVAIGSTLIGYSGNGTVAASKDRNPKNFLEFLLDAKLKYSDPSNGSIMGGFFSKYETNQSFSSKQIVYGLGTTYGKKAAISPNDFFALDIAYGRVDPKADLARQTALGTTTLNPYYRLNLELLFMYPVKSNNVSSVEFNYRYFLENNAPTAIKNTGLDKHQLSTLLLRLKNDMFVAYSVGKLPFDRKNDQIFQIGYSYKLN